MLSPLHKHKHTFLHKKIQKQVVTDILCSPLVHEDTHTQTVMLAQWLPALIECLSWQMDCWNHTCNAPLDSPLPFIHQGLCVSASMCALLNVFMCEDRACFSFLMSACASIHSLWVVSLKGSAMVTFNLVQPSNTEDMAMGINDSIKSNAECIHCKIARTQCQCISLLLTSIIKTTTLWLTMSRVCSHSRLKTTTGTAWARQVQLQFNCHTM